MSLKSHFIFFILINLIIVTPSCSQKQQKKNKIKNTEWWKAEASKMVDLQIAANGIKDISVLRAMKNTPRHLFVPPEMIKNAYADGPLPIGNEQTISQPYIVALMTELLQLKGNEKVLEIGTGSGYQAAILSQLVDSCYSVEIIKNLADSSALRLKKLGYKNVVVKCGDGYKGWKKHSPFDCIIITAAPEKIPEELIKQLKTGGRMVVPVGGKEQELLLITKNENGIKEEKIISVKFVPMVHPEKP